MKLVTNNFRYSSAKHFIDSVAESNTYTYYVFAGRSQPFANDNNVPTLYDNSQDVVYDVYDNMLYGKRVSSSDVSLMIKRYNWTANTVYARYDDQDELLADKQFYVINSNNAVFKCLNNNDGAYSVDEPVQESATDDAYYTDDGYQWKYMYTASPTTVAKFATAEYFPFVENTNVSANAINGSVDVVDLVSSGERRYTATTAGTFTDVYVGGNTLWFALASNASATDDIYVNSVICIANGAGIIEQRKIDDYIGVSKRVRIDSPFDTNTAAGVTTYTIVPSVTIGGNGSGAKARAVVNASTQTIENAVITNRGEGYDYVFVEVEGYVTSSTPAAPVLRALLPPPGGHGKNQATELRARWVGIASTISSSSSNNKVVDKNDYRIVGLLKNPKYRSVLLTLNPEHDAGSFVVGGTIYQSETNASGIVADIDETNNTITVEKVTGIFDVGTSGGVGQLIVTNPGSGYFANATVIITGTSGNGATANAQANALGQISSLNITAAGSGYLSVPSVSISPPSFNFNANTDVNPLSVKTFNALDDVSNTGNYIAISSNPFTNGDIVTYTVSTGNTAVTGLSNGEIYYVVAANSTVLSLANTVGGANIDLTAGSSESGHTLTNISRVEDYITVASNKFQLGDKVRYVANTGNTVVAGLSNGSFYYVRFSNTTAIKLSNTTGYPVTLIKGKTESGHNLIGETATGIAVITSAGTNVIRNSGNTVYVTANAVSGQETYFNQTLQLEVTNKNNNVYFVDDETVIQPGRTGLDAANGLFYSSSNSANAASGVSLRLTHVRGTFNTSGDGVEYLLRGTEEPEGTQPEANIQSQTLPDLVYGSGEVIYIESVPPITKNSNQTETFKFIFEF